MPWDVPVLIDSVVAHMKFTGEMAQLPSPARTVKQREVSRTSITLYCWDLLSNSTCLFGIGENMTGTPVSTGNYIILK